MEQTVATIAEHLHESLIGDGTVLIRNVNNLDAVQEGEVTFAEDARHLAQAMGTHAAAIIVPLEVTELHGRPGIGVKNPKLAFAMVLDLFHPAAAATGVIHPSAVLGEDVQLDGLVDIRANAVIGNHVRIGAGTTIEAGAYVGDDVSIGELCLMGPNTVIYHHTRIGHRVRIHGGSVIGGDGFGYVFHEGRHVKVPQVGDVRIEDDVEIGCNVCVDRATVGSTIIRRGTKIDNLVQIAHNNQIGQHVIITGQGGLSGSVTIGDYAVLGGRTGVTDHVTIGERAQVGICSVVTKSVAPGEAVWGYPARPVRDAKHQLASIARLPKILKALTNLLQRVGRSEARIEQLEHGGTAAEGAGHLNGRAAR